MLHPLKKWEKVLTLAGRQAPAAQRLNKHQSPVSFRPLPSASNLISETHKTSQRALNAQRRKEAPCLRLVSGDDSGRLLTGFGLQSST